MTTTDLLNTIAQGAPITARLAREIVTHLHRLRETEDALLHVIAEHAALQSRIRGKILFTVEEVAWIESALSATSPAVGAPGGRPQCGRPRQPKEPRP